ncbi:type II toxin -antitoxin system TacA 1-like antitoxin [Acidithiobacillus thiooxidans]
MDQNARLHIRCDHDIRSLLDKATSYTHMSVSEFVLKKCG